MSASVSDGYEPVHDPLCEAAWNHDFTDEQPCGICAAIAKAREDTPDLTTLRGLGSEYSDTQPPSGKPDTHDPLCPAPRCSCEPHDCGHVQDCLCEFIATVREDEQVRQYEAQSENWLKGYEYALAAVVQRVEVVPPIAQHVDDDGMVRLVYDKGEVIAAITGKVCNSLATSQESAYKSDSDEGMKLSKHHTSGNRSNEALESDGPHTHDPLCEWATPCIHGENQQHSRDTENLSVPDATYCWMCGADCVCELIATVREDERSNVTAEWMSNYGDHWEFKAGQADMLAKCIDALEQMLDVDPCDCDRCRAYTTAQAILRAIEERPCLLYTSPSPRDYAASRMPSSA